MGELSAQTCIVHARENLDLITSDEGLAAGEIALARNTETDRSSQLSKALADLRGYDYVVLDCAPALSVLNHNALAYAGEVLIPVSCDYLALVGVKQVLRTLRRVGEQIDSQVHVAGVVPTFYDVRNRVCVEVLGYLRRTFGPRTLPPVRVNTKLAESPSHKKTIFEHAPESHGARDYIRVVEWLRTGEGARPATRGGVMVLKARKKVQVRSGWGESARGRAAPTDALYGPRPTPQVVERRAPKRERPQHYKIVSISLQ
ncbi:MAG: ParA family protein [Myxococcota bacterium]